MYLKGSNMRETIFKSHNIVLYVKKTCALAPTSKLALEICLSLNHLRKFFEVIVWNS